MIAVSLFLVGAVYVVGGREFARRILQVRSRAAQALQPPTQAEMQRAAADTAASNATKDTDVAPVSVRLILIWSGVVLGIAVAAFFVSGRARVQRRD